MVDIFIILCYSERGDFMSRKPRIISESGMYHIVFRGINKQDIFKDEQDYKKIKGIIKDVTSQMGFVIYAYCLMTNHVHILIREENPGDISLIMKKILIRYVMWYNRKYNRTGGLIENRYKGYAINDDSYLLEVVRYIHNNPVRAGITKNRIDYNYSSYKEYFEERPDVVDKEFILSMITLEDFADFHDREDTGNKLAERLSDEELSSIILSKYHISPQDIVKLDKDKRKEIVRDMIKLCSQRQLGRVTGMSRKRISNMCE